MRPKWYTAGLLALALGTTSAAAGTGSLVLTDVAGDANTTGQQGWHVTGPASVDAADLVEVVASTESGGDGTPAALIVTFVTVGDPLSGPPLSFNLRARIGGCDSHLGAQPAGAPQGGERVTWIQFGETCPSQPPLDGWGTWHTSPAWTVTTGPNSVVLRVPFDSLTPEQAAVLHPGAVLQSPTGSTTGYYAVGTEDHLSVHGRPYILDVTPQGPDWTVGSDVG